MDDYIVNNEIQIQGISFIIVFALLAVWEITRPRRRLTISKPGRWVTNIGIAILNTVLLRVILPSAVLGAAFYAEGKGWGVLNNVSIPGWLAVAISVLVLDFIIYAQHVVFHKVPVLWRIHLVHHTDLDFDLTTGARFHPVEMFISMGVKIVSVVVLGAPALGVLIFELLLNTLPMFNHSNIRLPLVVDRFLRWMIVTPDMHRVHHSVARSEYNRNYGFNLPWWDRLCNTYRDQPGNGHEGMRIGQGAYRDAKRLTFPYLISLPFEKRAE